MCLSLPVQITRINGSQALGRYGTTEIELSLDLVDNIQVNDYVLVHTGFALEKISDEEAREQLAFLHSLNSDERPSDMPAS